jgi:hypothetical protein
MTVAEVYFSKCEQSPLRAREKFMLHSDSVFIVRKLELRKTRARHRAVLAQSGRQATRLSAVEVEVISPISAKAIEFAPTERVQPRLPVAESVFEPLEILKPKRSGRQEIRLRHEKHRPYRVIASTHSMSLRA